jgi:hypothetical protein
VFAYVERNQNLKDLKNLPLRIPSTEGQGVRLYWEHSKLKGPKDLACSAAILCTGGLDVIRTEAWPFYRTISGVLLCWELEEPKGPKGSRRTLSLQSSLRKGVSLGYVG